MNEQTSWNGAIPSLMDRLVDHGNGSRSDYEAYYYQSLDELKESIRREIERLFNTRTTYPLDGSPPNALTVLDYGVPDYSAFYPLDEKRREQLRKHLKRALETFEPRLQDVRVNLKASQERVALQITVEAKLVLESSRMQVSYPILVLKSDWSVEVEPPKTPNEDDDNE